ncbi:MAG: hypothetical protein P4L93_12050 [Coriobacteriia bacterium]|nr:hypothetical protein [Coriobacteriia bacterium]
MNAVTLVRRSVRFAFRRIAMPALVASLALGAAAGPHGVTARLAPKPAVIAQELQAHRDLPKGTTLTLGDPSKPFVVAYDEKGRILVTPPKGETFVALVARGFSQMGTLTQQATSALHPEHSEVAAAATVSNQ